MNAWKCVGAVVLSVASEEKCVDQFSGEENESRELDRIAAIPGHWLRGSLRRSIVLPQVASSEDGTVTNRRIVPVCTNSNGTEIDSVQWHMDAHTESHTSSTAPVEAFVQVLYVGQPGDAELVEALRHEGVGVIVAFDNERAARLLRHFRPDAILCSSADASVLLPHAEANIPVLTFAHDDSRRSSSDARQSSVVVVSAALAPRIREEIAARRAMTDT